MRRNLGVIGADPGRVGEVFESFGRYLGEFLWVGGKLARLEHILGEVAIDPPPQSSGILYVTAHYGNWELAGLCLERIHGPIRILYRPAGPEWLDRMVRRARGGNRLLNITRGLRSVVEALRRGEIVGAAIDEPVRSTRRVRFFGRAVSYPAPLLEAAWRAGAAVIPIVCIRNAEGRLNVRTMAPASDPAEIFSCFEEWIRRDPYQWILLRDRFFDRGTRE